MTDPPFSATAMGFSSGWLTDVERLREMLQPFGDLVAIGKPGETLPTPGAARLGDGGWVAGVAAKAAMLLAGEFLTVRKPESLSFLNAAALPMCSSPPSRASTALCKSATPLTSRAAGAAARPALWPREIGTHNG
jgi:hypothetical protein